jgi:hypothetical protein
MKSKIQPVHAIVASLTATAAFCSLGVMAGGNDLSAPESQHPATGLVKVVRQATARFHDVNVAEAEGYGKFLGCVSGEDEGAMGVHYVNGDLVGDGELDAERPEAVMYEQRDGRLRLVAAEFVVLADDWNAHHDTPPVLMGQSFHFNESPNRYGLPEYYDLHVWAWKDNPNGTFTEFNPDVSCEEYVDK